MSGIGLEGSAHREEVVAVKITYAGVEPRRRLACRGGGLPRQPTGADHPRGRLLLSESARHAYRPGSWDQYLC